MMYIFISSIIALLTLLLGLFFKYSNLNIKYKLKSFELDKLREENFILNEERIEHLIKIESLSTEIKLREESQEQNLKNSKSILYDLSNSVVNQLLDVHKKEVSDARKLSEEKIIKSTESFNAELQKVASLVGALNKDVESSKTIVDNLKNALLSPSSSGAFAEITLENLLKNSGLKDQIDYIMQYSFDGSDNNRLRPDAVIFLPENNLLLIDAKSSQFLITQESEEELLKSMNIHLKNLSNKDYLSEISENFKKRKIKFNRVSTVMFIPTEIVVERIMKADPNFFNKAWQYNIFPVGPSGLMNIISISHMHINEKLRIDNYEQIVLEINSLINSVSIISEHAFKLGNSIVSSVSNYDKFAASFNKNLVSKIKNLKTLGTGSPNKQAKLLERYQLVASQNELIDADASATEEAQELKMID